MAETTEKSLVLGETAFKIVEVPAVSRVHADVYTEARIHNGTFHLSLATLVFDGTNQPEARVCARLAIPLETVANIQTAITAAMEMIEKAKQAAN